MKIMRTFCLLISIFISTSLSAQTDTCFTSQQVISIAEKIQSAEDSIYLLSQLNSELERRAELYEILHDQDIKKNDLLKVENELLYVAIEKSQKRNTQKWYNSKIIYFAGGIATVFISAKVLELVIK